MKINRWFKFKIVKIVNENYNTKTFFIDYIDKSDYKDYFPGQYISFKFDHIKDNNTLVRSYTLSSAPNEDTMAFTIQKVENGLVSNWIFDNLKIGDILEGLKPIGNFYYNPKTYKKNIFMIAGGSGIAPFISILKYYIDKLSQKNSPNNIDLIVSYKYKKDCLFCDLLNYFNQNKNINVNICFTRENIGDFKYQRIDNNSLSDLIADRYLSLTFMICGPSNLVNFVNSFLIENGVDKKDIKTEDYG